MRKRVWLTAASLVSLSVSCGGENGTASVDAGRDGDGGQREPAADGAAACTPCEDCEESIQVASAFHTDGELDYPDPPPVGGDHHRCWLAYQVYGEEAPDERWVHNLEHGAVVFLYNCPDGCDAELSVLKEMAQARPQSLLTPYAALPGRFAVVSWGFRLVTDCFDEAQFARFYDEHVDRAPESVAGGPGCAGGG